MNEPPSTNAAIPRARLAFLAVLLLFTAVAYLQFSQDFRLASLAAKASQWREFQDQHPLGVFAVAFLVYVAVTGSSLPGATVLTLFYGWFFGFWASLPLVSFASTTGATIAFLASRYLLRDLIQARYGARLQDVQERMERDGAFYLFTLRLIPAVPFFVVNVVMGLTPLRTRTFWWVSQLGMLAGTVVYLLAGSSVPSLAELSQTGTSGIISPRLWLCFGLLAIFPFVARYVARRLRPERDSPEDAL